MLMARIDSAPAGHSNYLGCKMFNDSALLFEIRFHDVHCTGGSRIPGRAPSWPGNDVFLLTPSGLIPASPLSDNNVYDSHTISKNGSDRHFAFSLMGWFLSRLTCSAHDGRMTGDVKGDKYVRKGATKLNPGDEPVLSSGSNSGQVRLEERDLWGQCISMGAPSCALVPGSDSQGLSTPIKMSDYFSFISVTTPAITSSSDWLISTT